MSLPSWAKIGAEIICIDARWPFGWGPSPLIDRAKYTISGYGEAERVFDMDDRRYQNASTFLLAETQNPAQPANGFNPLRFRPVITKRVKKTAKATEPA